MRYLLGILFLFSAFEQASAKTQNCHLKIPTYNINKYQGLLENSIWVVPPSSLLAFQYVAGSSIPVFDQTVWVIKEFKSGYFFGDCYTSINKTTLSHTNMVGSISPLGDVYITFYPTDGNITSSTLVNGIGKFEKKEGQYLFFMQMNAANDNLTGLSHWSYMISVNENDCFYQNLPGENMTVPQFLSQF